MVKFSDAQSRTKIDRAGLVSIHERLFGMTCDNMIIPEIEERIKTFGRCECADKACKTPFKGYCEFDHHTPRGMAREGDAIEWRALTKLCHAKKTKGDVTLIAKTKRKARKHGVLRETDPMPEKRGNAKIQSRGFNYPDGYKPKWPKRKVGQ